MRQRTKFKTPNKPWLNGFVKRGKIYRFKVGYIIHSNGAFTWSDSIKEYTQSMWTATSISFPKVIEKVLNKNPKAYGNLKPVFLRKGILSWEVTHVDVEDPIWVRPKVVDETGEELRLYEITLTPEKLLIANSIVEKKTPKQYTLKKDLFYKKRWYPHEINKVMAQDPIFRPNPLHPKKCAICTLENLDEITDRCFQELQVSIENSLKKAQGNLDSLNLLKEQNGY